MSRISLCNLVSVTQIDWKGRLCKLWWKPIIDHLSHAKHFEVCSRTLCVTWRCDDKYFCLLSKGTKELACTFLQTKRVYLLLQFWLKNFSIVGVLDFTGMKIPIGTWQLYDKKPFSILLTLIKMTLKIMSFLTKSFPMFPWERENHLKILWRNKHLKNFDEAIYQHFWWEICFCAKT